MFNRNKSLNNNPGSAGHHPGAAPGPIDQGNFSFKSVVSTICSVAKHLRDSKCRAIFCSVLVPWIYMGCGMKGYNLVREG
jgi:hypothetical protein